MKEKIIERIESLKKRSEVNNNRLDKKKMALEKVTEWNSQNDEKETEIAREIINFLKIEIETVKGRIEEIDNEIVFLKNMLEIDKEKRGTKIWKNILLKELNP